MTKIAINGFGRIGRPTLKRILNNHKDLEIAAINDLADAKTLAHLLKYDSTYGIFDKTVKGKDGQINVGGQEIRVLAEKDPAKLPWKEMGIDIVLECSGVFTEYEGAKKHLEAGAKKVIISAPTKSKEIPTFVLGVNEKKYDAGRDDIISMASCTTNCLAPIVKILNDNFKIIHGFMTTVHSYTNDQRLLDLPHKDLRRARAAGVSIIPTTTGAAVAVTKTIPELEGKLDGIALRVPTQIVSIADLVCVVKTPTSAEEINHTLKKASQEKEFDGILGIEDAQLVSIDYKGNSFSSIVDASYTMVIDETLVKVLAWYDNEWGYACRLAEMAEYIGK
ncbi:MAG: type I glyceraldehyde-3-phosphate dehydrogenase [bacterium]